MYDLVTNVLALILVLGVMIFVHELGHFLVAKAFGIGVEVFSLGFGKRILGFRRGETDYRVSLLPLGGYVKMVGENPDEELSGADDEYLTKPKWQRLLVLVAGPAMNVLLAFVLLVAVYSVGVPVQADADEPVVIGLVAEEGPAADAGLRAGDRVVSVDGEPLEDWEEFRLRILISAEQQLQLGVIRDGEPLTVPIMPETQGRQGTGVIGVYSPLAPEVGPVQEDGSADRAGLQRGDRIVAIAGEQVAHFNVMAEMLSERVGQETRLVVERDGERFETTLVPSRNEAGQLDVGFSPEPDNVFKLRRHPFGEAVVQAGAEMKRQTLLVAEIIGRLFTGRMSVKTLSGPIEIARFSGGAARTGNPSIVLSFMAIISLQLGLLNLLPIPVLDGGQIAVILFEGAIRRDLSLRAKERIMQVGLILLVSLMAMVITLDITKVLPESWLDWLPF